MARRSLEAGARWVALWDIDAEGLEEAAELDQEKIITRVADVSNPEDVYGAADELREKIGTVDILFNNAGVVTGKSFAGQESAEIERTIRINVLGCMHVARAFLPGMIRQGRGHIVNLASAAGLLANPNMSVYCGSKWAVLGWSESLRLELEDLPGDLHVTTVCPSYIDTGMFDGVRMPAGGAMLDPEDVVRRILRAVKKNRILLYLPATGRLVPLLRGILPARWFDRLVGRWAGVYESMSTFHGHDGAGKSG